MTPTSPRGRKPGRRSSSTSRSSTIASADTRRWGTYPQPSTNGKTLNSLSTFPGELQTRHADHVANELVADENLFGHGSLRLPKTGDTAVRASKRFERLGGKQVAPVVH